MKAFYSVLPAPVRYSKILTADEKLLYGEISANLEVSGYCKVTNSEFSKTMNVDARTITNWISHLEKANLIFVKHDHKRHMRKIWLKSISVPDDVQPVEKLSEKQKEFAIMFPKRKIDTNIIPDRFDLKEISLAISQSDFLQRNNFSLKWFVENYDKIISGFYKDYVKTKKNGTQRDYDSKTMSELYSKVDEIEL